ncbi:duodenase-1-like [Malaclemys terrapin pileata]|uniref:duodenase-1-like n=1 Tax=Malaclemys terrapin pileata TaxID=2991368 RepID=UPI0023A8444A|nr:duodenase-1-like [Malaclemys terrapin pileata]
MTLHCLGHLFPGSPLYHLLYINPRAETDPPVPAPGFVPRMLLLLLSTAFLPFAAAFLLPPSLHSARVIRGQEALLGSTPYMAYVQTRSRGSCGGFLIRQDVVLTVAHCNCNLGKIFVYLGIQDFMKPRQNWQRIRARRWVQHPDFNNENFDNDIMLLKLWHKAELTEWVGLVPLPEADHHVSPGSKCSMTGWGRTGVNTVTSRLHEAEQDVVSDSLCRKQYRHYNPTTMLCAGSPHAKKSATRGDSGGPLVCNGVVQGIVSNGNPNGRPPSVYTRISKFIPWIKETLQKLS